MGKKSKLRFDVDKTAKTAKPKKQNKYSDNIDRYWILMMRYKDKKQNKIRKNHIYRIMIEFINQVKGQNLIDVEKLYYIQLYLIKIKVFGNNILMYYWISQL